MVVSLMIYSSGVFLHIVSFSGRYVNLYQSASENVGIPVIDEQK